MVACCCCCCLIIATCSVNDEWLCADRRQCIPYHVVCNGQLDCVDKSDEDIKTCRRLISYSTIVGLRVRSRVNVIADCIVAPGISEKSSLFSFHSLSAVLLNACERVIVTVKWLCPDAMWKCANGVMCVFKASLCNEWANCHDASDEANCREYTHRLCTMLACTRRIVDDSLSYRLA